MATQQRSNTQFALFALTSLFFFWGFLTCLNDILVPHLKSVFSLSFFEAALVQGAFFLSYFCSSIPAGIVVGKWGFKRGIVIGLLLAALGAFLFIPAAALPSFAFFLLALFVLASGITLLQVAANPYVTILGPKETASSRLNLTQAFNSLGTTVAPLIGGALILSAHGTTESAAEAAQTVNVPYMVMGSLLVLMALIFSKLKLQEVNESVEALNLESVTSALRIPTLLGGVLGIFVYVGAEVSIGSFLVNYISSAMSLSGGEQEAAKYVSIYWGLALVGRLLGSFLMRSILPGKFLAAAGVGAIALLCVTMLSEGSMSAYAVLAVGLCNSIMFPTIFTLGVRGLGSLTNIGSSLLIMAIVGGAAIPLIMGHLADEVGLKYAFLLPAFCYLYISLYGWFSEKVQAAD